jgi:hypothetical protein
VWCEADLRALVQRRARWTSNVVAIVAAAPMVEPSSQWFGNGGPGSTEPRGLHRSSCLRGHRAVQSELGGPECGCQREKAGPQVATSILDEASHGAVLLS